MKQLDPPPSWNDAVAALAGLPDLVRRLVEYADPAPRGEYLHWDKLRHLAPPQHLTREQWWLAVKLARMASRRQQPFRDERGRPFWSTTPELMTPLLHDIDRRATAHALEEHEGDAGNERRRYLVSAVMDEAITSSQLEGASTTRTVAKEMLRSGREPRDPSERMILGNYRAMERVRELRGERLTPEVIVEVHSILAPEHRLRTDADHVRIVERTSEEVLFAPAPAATIPASLEALCAFANGGTEKPFLHPVLRATTLHFWLSYVHPFTDGNGRTARALFYWAMLSQGYFLAEYLVLSRVLNRAPVQYARSFLYTESDDNDLTYFHVHQLRAIRTALDELFEYVQRKVVETRAVRALLTTRQHDFNHRQIALLSHALRNPDAAYTIESHMRSHGIVYETARRDLMDLASKRLLMKAKVRKAFVYRPATALGERLPKRRR